MKTEKSKRFYYYLTPDGKGYTIKRMDSHQYVEGAILNTKAAAIKDAKRRIQVLEQQEEAA